MLIYKKNKDYKQSLFKKYINPVVLFQAISLLMFFSKLKIKNNFLKKIISFFAPLVFGVLLFHCRLIRLKMKILKEIKDNYYFYYMILYGIVFFVLTALVDYLRLLIFNLFKIREFSMFIENIVPQFIDKILIITGLEKQNYEKIKN